MVRTRAALTALLLVAPNLAPLQGCSTGPSVCGALLARLVECSGVPWDAASQTRYLADCDAELREAEADVPACHDAFVGLGTCMSGLECGEFEGVWDDGPCEIYALAVFGDDECMGYYPF